MGSQCSALRGGQIKEGECYKPDQKNNEVSTTVKTGDKSPILQRRSSLQEQGRAMKETTEEQTLRRQEDTSFEKMGYSEKSSALVHEYTVQVNATR